MKTRVTPSFEICVSSQGSPASQSTVIGPQRVPWERRSWPSPTTEERAPQSGRPRISRSQIISRAHQFLEHHSGEAVRVHRLARVVGVSDRTLHNAFMEEYGVSPKRFLHLRVLNAARDELVRCNARHTRVTDVAARLGIWEWGRFARDYRALFGELPSETLRRVA